jgi:hypothetical protein
MIGYIKTQIVRSMKPGDKWWQVVPEVVERYNKEHVSRSTKMTPMEASQEKNRQQVKTNLESIRKMDNNQPRLDAGDKVRVILKKKFEKGYAPNWSERIYTMTGAGGGEPRARGRRGGQADPIHDRGPHGHPPHLQEEVSEGRAAAGQERLRKFYLIFYH